MTPITPGSPSKFSELIGLKKRGSAKPLRGFMLAVDPSADWS